MSKNKNRSDREVIKMLLYLALCFFCFSMSSYSLAQEKPTLEKKLQQLKIEFENDLSGIKEQQIISALALKVNGRAWMLAVSELGSEETAYSCNQRLEWLEQQWKNPKNTLDDKELISLIFYHEAINRLTVILAAKAHDNQALNELSTLMPLSTLTAGQGKTYQAEMAEAKVFWTNRLTALLPILIRIKSKQSKNYVSDIVTNMIDSAQAISQRKDVHYQARMNLLYLNNAQGLTSLHFILAKSENSPIIIEAKNIENTWREHVEETGRPVANQLALTWAANAQLSFPLAFWLATSR